jgi:diguanylate cyclase (GGDEF)-like protein
VPPNEDARLAALYDLEILDTPAEELYDDVVKLAAAICDAPIAIINFVDADRQWGKALVGLDDSEAGREASFCARTIVAEHGVLIVEDTLIDPAWAANPMVVEDPNLRFYAGAAIVNDEGHALGTVCVADRAPRGLTDAQVEGLRVLARQTSANLQLRRQGKRLVDANAELRRMAIEDPLTGLANRTLVFDRLTQALARRRRSDGRLGVLFCDLDSFKPINDRLGHQAGDDMLCLVAERMVAAARVTDTVARIAGDEFVVVCPDLGEPADLDRIAARIGASVMEPARVGGMDVTPRVSIGSALAELGDDAESLLARADEAMYVAKWHQRLVPEAAETSAAP